MYLKAVIFDFDGTLTKQGSIDFKKIKEQIGCHENQYILKYINTLTEKNKISALSILDRLEYEAAEESEEELYVSEVIRFLKKKRIPAVIISRNSHKSIARSLENFTDITSHSFYRIISRDDPFPVKPDPSSIFQIASDLQISPEEIIIVGDYIHDISAGINGGCKTIYKITGRDIDHLVKSDYRIISLKELIPIFTSMCP